MAVVASFPTSLLRDSCIETRPTSQTVMFAGQHVNLSAMAGLCHLSVSYISRILRGHRNPGQMSVRVAQQMAAALDMASLDEFIQAVWDARRRYLVSASLKPH